MLPDLSLIKKRRILAGLSQKELASLSGVSQSMIAKVESGKIEPSYSIIKKIFSVLERESKKEDKKCEEVMTKKVFFIDSNKKVKEASKIMHKESISQIPIKKSGKIVGTITENILLDKLSEGMVYEKLMDLEISEVMNPPLPMLSSKTSLNSILSLVKESGAILLMEKDEVKGIISKSDLI